jgi:UDP-glucuronate decarboxylase
MGKSLKMAVVTGGAGFIPSHLVDKLLAEGLRVIAFDNFVTGNARNVSHLSNNDHFKLIEHDVTEPFDVEGDVDYVFHMASPASPIDYVQIPIETLKAGSYASHNALDLALRKNAIYLVASTSEVYGDPEIHPQPESYFGKVNPIGIRSCYDEGKRCAETLFFDYFRQHQLDIKVIRIFNTYGPRMHPNDGRVVSNFIVQALEGKDITIYGDGQQTRSFCYVDDLIRGMISMMETEQGFTGPINIGNPGEFTMLELAELVIKLTGSKSKLVFLPKPEDDPKQRRPDIGLAKDVLKWLPNVQLEEGLKKTIDYFRATI